jgi:hypothetical protein
MDMKREKRREDRRKEEIVYGSKPSSHTEL